MIRGDNGIIALIGLETGEGLCRALLTPRKLQNYGQISARLVECLFSDFVRRFNQQSLVELNFLSHRLMITVGFYG